MNLNKTLGDATGILILACCLNALLPGSLAVVCALGLWAGLDAARLSPAERRRSLPRWTGMLAGSAACALALYSPLSSDGSASRRLMEAAGNWSGLIATLAGALGMLMGEALSAIVKAEHFSSPAEQVPAAEKEASGGRLHSAWNAELVALGVSAFAFAPLMAWANLEHAILEGGGGSWGLAVGAWFGGSLSLTLINAARLEIKLGGSVSGAQTAGSVILSVLFGALRCSLVMVGLLVLHAALLGPWTQLSASLNVEAQQLQTLHFGLCLLAGAGLTTLLATTGWTSGSVVALQPSAQTKGDRL